ncbi:hypothetical protein JF50_25650 [Pseudoalteromonas luteoviolacea]|uniref:Uncharacterized protein n=1 Tax=Pseudoalteromonas luteoviolacea TaxID=43657 RepID=A0A0C1MEI1_9GAMM|nr:hypothetical protein JF50_25650 [Pseudoalteromonas luteoviolacea]
MCEPTIFIAYILTVMWGVYKLSKKCAQLTLFRRLKALEQARITEIQYIHYRNFDVVPVFSQGSGGSATPSSISCALYTQE